MRALVLEANGQLRFHTDYPEQPAPIEGLGAEHCVRVQVAACGVCGSDIPRAFEGGAYHYPLVLGHEFSGVVVTDGVTRKKGDRVAVFPLIPRPGEKPYDTGDYAQTKRYDYYGSRRDGGMGEFVTVPERNLFLLPDHVELLHAACTEPAAVALHGVRKMRVQAGDDAVVFGAGPIGNLVAQWLKIGGCARVFVVDIDQQKLDLVEKIGCLPVNPQKTGDAVAQILEATGGEGVQRVVEAVGNPMTFVQATQVAAAFGEVVFMGNIHGEFKIGEKDFSNILRRELTIYGTWNSKVVPVGTDDWSTVLKFMDRQLQIAPMVSNIPSLEEGPAIMSSIHQRKSWHHKVIFKVSPDLC
ncbi:MAG: galactitol-1-phosphate 5-dehydrogenase [Opitutales bacterium]|nr:galactitol-1-phosphate 5-dehydrogenase [Opitutales bacterium]